MIGGAGLEDLCWQWAIVGGLGGLVGVIVRERGCLYIPRWRDGVLYINSLYGVVLGAVGGMIGDANYINAFVWGISGATVIPAIVDSVDRTQRSKSIGKCQNEEAES